MFNTVFQCYFSDIEAAIAPTHAFLELFLPVLCKIFFTSHMLLSHITVFEKMDCSERRMNHVADESKFVFHADKKGSYSFNPLPHMPILGSSNSAANKDMISKIWTNGDTII